jgi:hypothetical protein
MPKAAEAVAAKAKGHGHLHHSQAGVEDEDREDAEGLNVLTNLGGAASVLAHSTANVALKTEKELEDAAAKVAGKAIDAVNFGGTLASKGASRLNSLLRSQSGEERAMDRSVEQPKRMTASKVLPGIQRHTANLGYGGAVDLVSVQLRLAKCENEEDEPKSSSSETSKGFILRLWNSRFEPIRHASTGRITWDMFLAFLTVSVLLFIPVKMGFDWQVVL